MNPLLSIFIITKNRVDSLQRLLQSLSLAYNSSNLDIWVGYDYDDIQTVDFIKKDFLSHKLDISTFLFEGPGTALCTGCQQMYLNRHRDILHPMVERSRGKYFWILNDDVEIRTPNFDIIIEDYIETFLKNKNDRLVYVKTGEVFRNHRRGIRARYLAKCDYACYPLITREVFEALGFFLPIQFPTGGADIALAKIFNRSVANRSISIPDVICYDHIDPFVSDTPPHNTTVPYGAYEMNKDILKIDAMVQNNLEAEAVELHAIRVQIVVSCKSCHNEILVPTELSTNMVVCSNCNARNVIANRHLELSYQLTATEESLTGNLLGADDSETALQRIPHG